MSSSDNRDVVHALGRFARRIWWIWPYLGGVGGIVAGAIQSSASPEPPRLLFGTACVLAVAAVAFPQCAVAVSRSVIARSLLPKFYHRLLLPFVIIQCLVALLAVLALHSQLACYNPTIVTRAIAAVAVFDPVYLVWYMIVFIERIIHPERWLEVHTRHAAFRSPTRKGAPQGPNDPIGVVTRIANEVTTDHERGIILKAIRDLSQKVAQQRNPPERSVGDLKNLIEATVSACTNELRPGDETTTGQAIEVVAATWETIQHWTISGDYALFPRAFMKLGQYSVRRGYENNVLRSVECLRETTESAVFRYGSGTKVSPSVVAEMIAEVARDAASARPSWALSLARECFTSLLSFAERAAEHGDALAYEALRIAVAIWSAHPFAREELLAALRKLDDPTLVRKAVQCAQTQSPTEAREIQDFLKPFLRQSDR